MSKVNADDLIVISADELDKIQDSVAMVRGVDGTIAPKSFLTCLQTVNGAYSTGTTALEELHKIKGQMLLDWGNETRLAESLSEDIPFSDLADRILNAFPIAYNKAADGDRLYMVNFSYNRFVAGGNFRWYNNINSGAVIEEDYALKVDNTDVEQDQRYIGTFPMYDLENKTYTLEFDFFKEVSLYRHRVFFANGVFLDSATGGAMSNSRCDTYMNCLGFGINCDKGQVPWYNLVDNGSYFVPTNITKPTNIWEADASGECTTQLKIVLRGGAKKNVTIYKGNGTIQTANVATWTGDIIPIYFTIYREGIIVADGLIYHRADIPLVFGTGSYEKPTASQYYGIRDLSIWKGDTVNPKISFKIYDNEYTVPEGTTWETFIDNNSNIGLSYADWDLGADVFIGNTFLTDITNQSTSGKDVRRFDKIVANGRYSAPVDVVGIILDHDGDDVEDETLTIAENSYKTFTASVYPAYAYDTALTWESSNNSVITITSKSGNTCIIKGVSAGTATIKVSTSNGVTESCTVTVKAVTVPVESITLDKSSISLDEGGTSTLVATILPLNATDKTVHWSTSDSYVATVSEIGLVTAVGVGNAVITATTINGKTASCSVEVTAVEEPEEPEEPSATIKFVISCSDRGDAYQVLGEVPNGYTWGDYIDKIQPFDGYADEIFVDDDTTLDMELYGRVLCDPGNLREDYPDLREGLSVYLYNSAYGYYNLQKYNSKIIELSDDQMYITWEKLQDIL